MIWWQSECKYGDMIRVSFGNFYHYGIFVSEDEVIQFGLPPVEGLLNRRFDEISVCVTDIDTFAAGKMVEVASVKRGEKPKRLSPRKTVSRAKSHIGEKGYDILHNNCEHFARYCYFGEKRCEVTEQVVHAWHKTNKCDIYFSKIPTDLAMTELFPAERQRELEGVTNQRLREEKYWSWKTLEYALYRSFGYKFDELAFSKSKSGKWLCDKCCFSISHSAGYVAVAVSGAPIGIDLEEVSSFCEKCENAQFFDGMIKHSIGKKDSVPATPSDLLKLWTQKESVFKREPARRFVPKKTEITGDVATLEFAYDEDKLVCSIAGCDAKKSFFYRYDGSESSKIKDIVWIF